MWKLKRGSKDTFHLYSREETLIDENILTFYFVRKCTNEKGSNFNFYFYDFKKNLSSVNNYFYRKISYHRSEILLGVTRGRICA